MRLGFDGLPFPTGIIPRLIGFATGRMTVLDSGGVEPDIIIRGHRRPCGLRDQGVRYPHAGAYPGSVSILVAGGTAIVGDLLVALLRGGRPRMSFRAEDPAAAREESWYTPHLRAGTHLRGARGPWS